MKKIIKNKSTAHKSKIQKKKEIRKKLRRHSKSKNIEISDENINITAEEKNVVTVDTKDDEKKIKILIRDIFNIREVKRQLSFLGLDYKSISINEGNKLYKSCCNILTQIDEIINSKELDHRKKKDKYFELSKQYYKLIPHTFPFPDYNLYLINEKAKIKREICFLEIIKSFSELETTFNKIKNERKENDLNNSINLKDSMNLSEIENIPEEENHTNINNFFYEKALDEFDYEIKVIKHDTEKYYSIKELIYSYSTKGKGSYIPLTILELFSLNKRNEKITNENNLLFYGCEIVHFYSILKNGLRLPFKEAPKNAYIYGKGILLSDNPYIQIQKCLPKNKIVYLFICNVDKVSPKNVHMHHYSYPKYLDSKFNCISIKHKINLPPSENSNEDEKLFINRYDYIFYEPSLIKIKYIVKLQIP